MNRKINSGPLRKILCFSGSILLLAMTASADPAPKVVPLWDGPAPQSHGTAPNDIPTLTLFLPDGATKPTSVIILFPGGGYGHLAFDHEGLNEGAYFKAKGVAAFVLRYRLPTNGYRYPVPMLDARRAIRLIRSHAADWNIDPAKIGIMGFSAGGHLASTIETHFDAGDPQAPDPIDRLSSRPDFAVLVYAVISLKEGQTNGGTKLNLLGPNPDPALVENLSNETQVTPQTPPTLLIHADNDGAVPIKTSKLMLEALQKAGVPSALQEYPTGGHGFGYQHKPVDNAPPGWLDKAYDWLKGQGLVP